LHFDLLELIKSLSGAGRFHSRR